MSKPNPEIPKKPHQDDTFESPPPHLFATFLGLILFFLCAALCYFSQTGIPLLVGLLLAIASIFCRYRCIFVGFILSIGLTLLLVISFCFIGSARL